MKKEQEEDIINNQFMDMDIVYRLYMYILDKERIYGYTSTPSFKLCFRSSLSN